MRHTAFRITLSAALVVACGFVPTALAGKGKPGGGGGGGGGSTSSLQLVLLDSTDGLPHWGQRITFNVSTTATDRPFVSVNCYQGSVWVYADSVGYFADYPWVKEFTLAAASWPSGAADCTARLYSTKDGTRTTTLATLSLHVYA